MITKERVEAVLDRVRPFLQADAGDIVLVAAHGNSADVRLTGLCAIPPSRPDAPISFDDRLREVETTLIGWVLKASNGNQSRAAELPDQAIHAG
jgi:NifU-like protein